jgi:hypothetical protein
MIATVLTVWLVARSGHQMALLEAVVLVQLFGPPQAALTVANGVP